MDNFIFDGFMETYLSLKKESDDVKIHLGERWHIMYDMYKNTLDFIAKENNFKTKIQCIIELSLRLNSKLDLLFLYSLINQSDIDLFQNYLKKPILSGECWKSSNS